MENSRFLMRRLDSADEDRLAVFLERNNRPEVTDYFRPFPLTRQTAGELLAPYRRDLFFGVEENGEILGLSMLRGWDEGYAIPSFGILIDYRYHGRGLGQHLTEWTLRWADQMGTDQVRLSVFEQNRRAHHLYETLGFMETSRSTLETGGVRLIMMRSRPAETTPVYISTECLAKNGESLEKRLFRLMRAGIRNVELTNYSIPDNNDFLSQANAFQGRLLLHHYFPALDPSLVLNLASENVDIQQRTLRFFERSIDWSAHLKAPCFSCHAGYISDPIGRNSYGFLFPEPTAKQTKAAMERFLGAVTALTEHANAKNVQLLIENNVCSESNKGKLLLSTPDEFQDFFAHRGLDRVGLLLDWGHWTVTALSYNLPLTAFEMHRPRVVGLHLHTNNGRDDEHKPVSLTDAELSLLKTFSPAYFSLEGHYLDLAHLQQQLLQIERYRL